MVKKPEFSSRFLKKYDKADAKIQSAFKRRFKLFLEDPANPLLRNHALRGKYKGFRSINVTGNWRAVYAEKIEYNQRIIVFHEIGTHSQLYG